MKEPEDANTPTTRLLNTSAFKSRKRMRQAEESSPHEKPIQNKRKIIQLAAEPKSTARPSVLRNETDSQPDSDTGAIDAALDEIEGDENGSADAAQNSYEQHFGPNPEILTESHRMLADQRNWESKREKIGKLTAVISLFPEEHVSLLKKLVKKTAILERLRTPFEARQAKQPADENQVQNDLLSILSAHLDLYHPAISLKHHQCIREAIALHTLDHITKKRRRILKNNERISHASSDPPEDVQDQGFTRPSVLILLPFRSSALAWINALTSHTPSFQIENHTRFLGEYDLPPDAVDKLVTAPPGTYPADHVEMFKGNVDDSFRMGIKLTRKSVKLFADFYSCDLILASPLGLRMSIEKEKSADFLSSIEILVVDQMNALAMQNWEHTQFILSHLNNLPKESRDADFSRIKPWYLDGHSAYLRQSILMSPFEIPETRSLFNASLKNVAGKVRVEKTWPALQVPEGVDQTFLAFDCSNPKDEADKRFSYFTTQLLPKVLKSAVQSANTVVFVPSSFDFIRVRNYFRKQGGISFAVLSEYSSNQDISRARQAFFSGKKSFLLISERFHFYRRYKIRGIRNILFYGPPSHPQFFSEFLTYPFLDDGVEASDITCRVVSCRYDWFKLERILGSKGVNEVLEA
ncbi:digestive organ expansion factor [Paxillus ammoniavirescens]|nr:digestive organ expansion factor [Paxillus ammoniavirescens]